ncbi:MAG TPA: exodeoxyribonuclease VII large subunit [Clostridiaceae bacterium]|nr:exodeoxyribonuclease VII large subunit [Clostridiaceae bacterium]
MMDLVFSVSELNRAVNARLSRDPELSRVRVRGEISGLKKYPSGHSYFTLKDEEASVSCVLFRQSAGNAPPLREGMQVVLLARPNLYDKTGRFQLLVDQAREEGVGDLYRRFLDLKESLEKEGIFDQKNKKPIPYLPGRIVAVTSEAGAVIRDMIHVIRRRFPGMRLILIPVPVQGQGAELEIAAAIELANILELGDVIIVGRGGGSLEDLQPFNEEVTARAIAASNIPVISAVGHETDFTISDFAADLRAPTPSAAAELAVPVKADLFLRIQQLSASLEQSLSSRLDQGLKRIEDLQGRPVLSHPAAIIDRHAARRTLLGHRLESVGERILSREEGRIKGLDQKLHISLERKERLLTSRLEQLTETLHALSPLAVLSRGFTLVTDKEGRTVQRAGSLEEGQALDLFFQDGRAGCLVEQLFLEESAMKGQENG